MEYLIDTHVIIWAIADRKMLSKNVIDILEDPAIKIFVSPISFFEIAIKLKFINSTLATGFELLPIKNEHFAEYSNFDFSSEHRDPFDRYLVATAVHEGKAFITKDSKFSLYEEVVQIVW